MQFCLFVNLTILIKLTALSPGENLRAKFFTLLMNTYVEIITIIRYFAKLCSFHTSIGWLKNKIVIESPATVEPTTSMHWPDALITKHSDNYCMVNKALRSVCTSCMLQGSVVIRASNVVMKRKMQFSACGKLTVYSFVQLLTL